MIFRVRDWIRILSAASDFQLFWIAFAARFFFSVCMVAVFGLVSCITKMESDNLFIRDNSFILWPDQRMAPLGMWDGVHFASIANDGYKMENNYAFFPGFPWVVRFVTFITTEILPFLTYLFPVTFYVTLLNLTLSSLTLVLLRRLTIVTYLGPLGLICYGNRRMEWKKVSFWASQTGSLFDAPLLTRSLMLNNNEEGFHLLHSPGSPFQNDDAKSTTESDVQDKFLTLRNEKHQLAVWKGTQATDHHRSDADVLVGAVCLAWICNPAGMYYSIAYTEALFSFLTTYVIYLLCWNHQRIPGIKKDNIHQLIPKFEGRLWDLYLNYQNVEEGLCSVFSTFNPSFSKGFSSYPSDDSSSTVKNQRICVQFKEDLFSKEELLCCVLLFFAGFVRSNAFLFAGFFWYPIFIQLFFPPLYRRRLLQWYAPQWWTSPEEESSAEMSNERKKNVKYNSETGALTFTIHGVHRLDRRISFSRIFILLIFTFMSILPYIYMNYSGWSTFVPLWGNQTKSIYGAKVSSFYAFVQHRFWDVGLFCSLQFANLPHIIHPVPLLTFAITGLRHVLCCDLLASSVNTMEDENSFKKSDEDGVLQIIKGELKLVLFYIQRILSSSTITLLLIHFAIGVLVMNINVLSRFVVGLPSLYWMIGSLIAKCPTHPVTRFIPIIFASYSILGIALFSLNYDWT